MADKATNAEKSDRLSKIAQEVESLTSSPLYGYRKENNYHMVFGEGSSNAEIVFIGEAPGKSEAKQGRPFVGASGRILDELLEGIGLRREDVYITNVVKDRPPENRDPRKGEIALYTPFLIRQLEVIEPAVIATLGRFAMEFIFDTFDMEPDAQKISKVHGSMLEASTSFGNVTILPLYHPAVALYNSDQKQTLIDDFEQLRQYVK